VAAVHARRFLKEAAEWKLFWFDLGKDEAKKTRVVPDGAVAADLAWLSWEAKVLGEAADRVERGDFKTAAGLRQYLRSVFPTDQALMKLPSDRYLDPRIRCANPP
jgi:hypothetical protein